MIAIIDYKAGNLTSVELALKHVGADCKVTDKPEEIARADKVIFPGVGTAQSCMDNLRNLGLDLALKDAVNSGKPVMAICIGQQLIFEHSEEDGGVDCLGILPGKVVRFDFEKERNVKVPHMGWNEVEILKPHPILTGFPDRGECYFVHSYYVKVDAPELVYAQTDYEGNRFTCAVGRDNLFATQFHPEKSGEDGLQLLRNFLNWNGKQ